MEQKEMLTEAEKKPYQKPELIVHGSVEKITEQIATQPGGVNIGLSATV
jgi:hypothetical protein